MAQHEYRHRKYCGAVDHMPGVPIDATMRESVTLRNSLKTMDGDRC